MASIKRPSVHKPHDPQPPLEEDHCARSPQSRSLEPSDRKSLSDPSSNTPHLGSVVFGNKLYKPGLLSQSALLCRSSPPFRDDYWQQNLPNTQPYRELDQLL